MKTYFLIIFSILIATPLLSMEAPQGIPPKRKAVSLNLVLILDQGAAELFHLNHMGGFGASAATFIRATENNVCIMASK